MIITFSNETLNKATAPLATRANLDVPVDLITDRVSCEKYNGNLRASITWAKGRRVRFTIQTRDAFARGSRVSANGRHMRKASWEAHRDVMRALLTLDPQATIRTAFITYRGLADFEARHSETAMQNVGSNMDPRTISECSVY